MIIYKYSFLIQGFNHIFFDTIILGFLLSTSSNEFLVTSSVISPLSVMNNLHIVFLSQLPKFITF